jgi:hypothetical protein
VAVIVAAASAGSLERSSRATVKKFAGPAFVAWNAYLPAKTARAAIYPTNCTLATTDT